MFGLAARKRVARELVVLGERNQIAHDAKHEGRVYIRVRELCATVFYFIVRAKCEQRVIFFGCVNVFQNRHSWCHALKRDSLRQIIVEFHDTFNIVRVVKFVIIHSFYAEAADQFIPAEFAFRQQFQNGLIGLECERLLVAVVIIDGTTRATAVCENLNFAKLDVPRAADVDGYKRQAPTCFNAANYEFRVGNDANPRAIHEYFGLIIKKIFGVFFQR